MLLWRFSSDKQFLAKIGPFTVFQDLVKTGKRISIDTVGKGALKLWNSFTSKASENIALAQKVAKF